MDGVLIIDKEKGYTSNDVVAKLRGILRQKKIGHAGTLDPDATGVLVVLLGKATRLSDLLMSETKRYETELKLGVTTDTQDISGTVISEKPFETDPEKIRSAVKSFVGSYDQIPPMYSAIKIGGRKLYQLARKGEEVRRPPRRVAIGSAEIKELEPPFVSIDVTCSKGTYIRTLCNDIGERLGCGATMTELRRVSSGSFSVDDAVKIDDAAELFRDGALEQKLLGMDRILKGYNEFTVFAEAEKALLNGNKLSLNSGTGSCSKDGYTVVRDHAGEIKALYTLDEKNDLLKPAVMLL